jgi:energy-coupling factor transporter ATP-binding protein EcfA2
MNPQILVLDEPSAGLDPRGRRNLIRLLQDLQYETMLIGTHDLKMALELCSRTVILKNGTVVADGPTTQILNDTALLEEHGLEAP